MRVIEVAVTVVDVPQRAPLAPYRSHLRSSSTTQSAIVRVDTDEGITGWGEHNINFLPDISARRMQDQAQSWLVGRDPRDIEGLWQLMYAGSRFPGGMVLNAAISGIEHALWDIAGKAAGLLVHAHVVAGLAQRGGGRQTSHAGADDCEAWVTVRHRCTC